MNLYRNIRNRWKFCVFLIIFYGIINEWVLFIVLPWLKWPQLGCASPDSIRLLVVSDPQLLGEQFTYASVFGFIARWDADRYIAATFNKAIHHVKPDVILFLGDLLDEGEVASTEEYIRYLRRFKIIFHRADKSIIIPGDNDIGGEDGPPSIEMEQRFDRVFGKDQFVVHKFIEFVKVNYMTQSSSYLSVPKPAKGMFRIVLSHVPLMASYSIFSRKVLDHLQPHLILSAHDHAFKHFVLTKKSGVEMQSKLFLEDKAVISMNLTEAETHEIVNPTCSYRMGTTRMGYGAVTLNSLGYFSYVVLWLPSRFHHLGSYLGLFVIIIVIIFIPPSASKKNIFCNFSSLSFLNVKMKRRNLKNSILANDFRAKV